MTAVNMTQPSAGRMLGESAVTVQWRPGAPLLCPVCGQTAPRYDSRPRRWQHLNAMQRKTFIVADVPRVNCPQCGVKQIEMAVTEDRSRFTELFEAFAIQVLKAVRSKARAPWLTALSWDQVGRIVVRAAHRGSGRRSLEGLSYTGLDEKSFGRGHDYVSVSHDIVGKWVLDVAPERIREAADMLWATIPEARRQGVAACAMDMQETYLEATRAVAPQAVTVHWATRSRLELIITAAKTLKRHFPGLLAYTKHRITNVAAEGTNGRIELFKANVRGYRNFAQYRMGMLFHCGILDLCPNGRVP